MSEPSDEFSNVGFAKTYMIPALFIFMLPVLSYLFFDHVEATVDEEVRQQFLQDIRASVEMDAAEKAKQIQFVEENDFSDLLVLDPQYEDYITEQGLFDYATFRWMNRLAAISILTSMGVFLLGGVCVVFSLRSQYVQYLSLLVGWHVLRINAAIQALIQGVLLVTLSYWVTAFWFEIYIVKLIIIIGIMAICGVFLVIKAIFERSDTDSVVEGKVITRDDPMPLWEDLRVICQKVGTQLPDQVIAGIDDSFYVTEHPVTVGEKKYTGRTLFVSLSLLKQLDGEEANAILAHEMAHFSGEDTMYSLKIFPLLNRYDMYLYRLYEGGITIGVFYYMNCFRAMFELSLRKISREREYRADAIAAQVTSAHDFASALLRVVAYSQYRTQVQTDLFDEEQALETANIAEQIENGFQEYSISFASDKGLGEVESAHPFDSHPPLHQRFEAIGVRLEPESAKQMLMYAGNGLWFDNIRDAHQLERQQWDEFEEMFRKYHEESLAYRYVPETDQETELVLKYFPPRSFTGKDGDLQITFDKIEHAKWNNSIGFGDIKDMSLDDSNNLTINYQTTAKVTTDRIRLGKFGKEHQEILDVINLYYGRHMAAAEYLKEKGLETNE